MSSWISPFLLLVGWIPPYIVSLLFAAALKSQLTGVSLRFFSGIASFLFWIVIFILIFKGQKLEPGGGQDFLTMIAILHGLVFAIQVWRDKKGQRVQ